MKCPVCESLNREHSLECQIEATAVIKLRREMIRRSPPEIDVPDDSRGDIILTSRKRQAQIVHKLDEHKARAHSA
jgi:hypothetical protein